MTKRPTRPFRWATYLLILSLATAAVLIAALGAATPKAHAYWVCGPTTGHWRGADTRCQYPGYRSTISYIQKLSSPRAYAVYRSAYYGGPSVSGNEYYSSTSNYYLQDFHCYPGYPNAHNRHSISVWVEYTLAGSC